MSALHAVMFVIHSCSIYEAPAVFSKHGINRTLYSAPTVCFKSRGRQNPCLAGVCFPMDVWACQ